MGRTLLSRSDHDGEEVGLKGDTDDENGEADESCEEEGEDSERDGDESQQSSTIYISTLYRELSRLSTHQRVQEAR